MRKIYIECSDLDNFFKDLFAMQLTKNYVFRGFCDYSELEPSLLRNYDNNPFTYKMAENEYERHLLEEYAKYSVQYLPSFSHSLDWVASAQHFGLPTRLIDWTWNPFVALFFSVINNKETKHGTYKLLALNIKDNLYFNKIPLLKPDVAARVSSNHDHIDNYLLLVDGIANPHWISSKLQHERSKIDFGNQLNASLESESKDGKHKLFLCSLNHSNDRINAQEGLFQIPRRFYNMETKERCIIDDTLNACEFEYGISVDSWSQIVNRLENLNITPSKLFPDLASICYYLKRGISIRD